MKRLKDNNVYLIKDKLTNLFYEKVCGTVENKKFVTINKNDILILKLNIIYENKWSDVEILCRVVEKSKTTLFVERITSKELN